MAERWITVATFSTPEQAHIACNALHEIDLPARLRDDVIVGLLWNMGLALGDVKVQVPEQHVAAAREFLEHADEADAALDGADPSLAHEHTPQDDSPPDDEFDQSDEDEFPPRSQSAQLTDRAWKAAVVGLIVCPGFLHAYSIWNLLKAAAVEEPDDGTSNWKWYAALLLNLAVIGYFVVLYKIFAAFGPSGDPGF